jgi:capsular polysaccharide transport system permease protein
LDIARSLPEPRMARLPGLRIAPVEAPGETASLPAFPADRWRRPRRHIGLASSFVLLVVLPFLVTAAYMFAVATDQYHSEAAFSVRSEDRSGASALGVLGAITQIGTGTASDTDILQDFIHSQSLVEAVDADLDLRAIFAKAGNDPVFGFRDDGTVESLLRYWTRMVHVIHDTRAGTISLRTEAFAPADAQAIASSVLAQSGRLVNDLSDRARRDAVRFAEADLADAERGLRALRAQLAQLRDQTRMIDPAADVAGQMGVVGALQAELAGALIARDSLTAYAGPADHRVIKADRRIAAIEDRIAAERSALGAGPDGTNPSAVMGQYEVILTDIEFAQAAYTQALTNLALARAESRREARYLAVHIEPTLAQSSLYPRRGLLTGLAGLGLLLFWAVLAVAFYNMRDAQAG